MHETDVTWFFGPKVTAVFLRPALAGRKTVNILTNRKRGCSPEQIVRKIQDADHIRAEGGDVGPVLKELNVTEATCYRWRAHQGGLKAEEGKKLKQLEKQNPQLKKLRAEAELENHVLKELTEGIS